MSMTDTDRLSTPNEMVELLKHLTKIVRDVETLPDIAQARFWDDVDHNLQAIPVEDLRLENVVSQRSVTVLYSILSTLCGPRLAEVVNGGLKEYYESLLAQMKDNAWDVLLDQKFADHEGSFPVSAVSLATLNSVGGGFLKRVAGSAELLTLTDPNSNETRYFSSKAIIMVELDAAAPAL